VLKIEGWKMYLDNGGLASMLVKRSAPPPTARAYVTFSMSASIGTIYVHGLGETRASSHGKSVCPASPQIVQERKVQT
jgi:hypothetical protein